MGHTRTFAEKMNLGAMTPRSELASTKFCLSNPGKQYLIDQPKSGEGFSVELSAGKYDYEWFNPVKGEMAGSSTVQSSGGRQQFKASFAGEAVLYIQRAKQ